MKCILYGIVTIEILFMFYWYFEFFIMKLIGDIIINMYNALYQKENHVKL